MDRPTSATGRPEVWIGELWSRDTQLCAPAGPYSWARATPEAHSERVVLLLDADSDRAAPTGRIRFAEGELPAEPPPIPPPSPSTITESLQSCTQAYFARGGEYSLLESRRSHTRLEFVVAPAEIWRDWCASQGRMPAPCPEVRSCSVPSDVPCPCGESGCVGQRIRFDFTVAGDTMETSSRFEGVEQVRLRRVQ